MKEIGMNKFGFNFNKIIVIESLPDHEKAARGAEVCSAGEYFQNQLFPYCNSFKENRIQTELYKVNSKNDFLKLLDDIAIDVTKYASNPILHFEIHGREEKDGLTLNNSDFVDWKLLHGKLTVINEKTLNNLFVLFATCSGAFNIKSILPRDKIFPYYAAAAPESPEFPAFLEQSYSLFYISLLVDLNVENAFKELQNSEGYSKIIISTCEYYLYEAFRNETKERFSQSNINRLVSLVSRTDQIIKMNDSQIKERLIKILNDTNFGNATFSKMKNKYLMANHPKNANRFKFTLKELNSFFEKKEAASET
jgi:hypothetical protein